MMKSARTASYIARYKDSFGEEGTTIFNDGKAIAMMLRGVRFRGHDFDCFEPLVTAFDTDKILSEFLA